MSTLLLVRHGQAQFLQPEYDRLSPLGEAQAKATGAHLAERLTAIHAVFAGPRQRQQRTAEIACDALRAAGVAVPDLQTSADLDEHDLDILFKEHMPALAKASPAVAELVLTFGEAPDLRARARVANRMLRAILELWAADHAATTPLGTFAAFRARADRAVSALTAAEGTGRTVVAFSSGGLIGAAVAGVLGAGDAGAVELGLVIYNASISELLYTKGRASLLSFNTTPHLDKALLTHR